MNETRDLSSSNFDVNLLEEKPFPSVVAVVGSREFSNKQLVRDFVLKLPKETKVISGGARGVDKTAIAVAQARGMQWQEFLPDKRLDIPERYHKRNRQIVREADLVVIFWDGKSDGSAYVKDFCEKIRREHMVIADESSGSV